MLFGQASVKSTFAHGPHAGRTIGEVAQGLRAGTISADTLPIDYVVRNGQAIALSNRSLLALTRAGMQLYASNGFWRVRKWNGVAFSTTAVDTGVASHNAGGDLEVYRTMFFDGNATGRSMRFEAMCGITQD